MAATTQSVIDRITELANDPGLKRLTLPVIARWLNEGALVIATASVRAAGAFQALTLAAGSRQDLRLISPTTDWIRLHALVCSGAAATGPAIFRVDHRALSDAIRTWRATATSATVEEWSQDESDGCVFDVFPPATAGAQVFAHVSKKPVPFCVLNGGGTALLNSAETVPLATGFDIPLVDYVLMRYYQRWSEVPNAAARAQAHQQLFMAGAGLAQGAAKGA